MSPKANRVNGLSLPRHFSFSLKSAAGTLPVIFLSKSGRTSTCLTAYSKRKITLQLFIKWCIQRKHEPADHSTLLYQKLISTQGGNGCISTASLIHFQWQVNTFFVLTISVKLKHTTMHTGELKIQPS